MYCQRTPRCDSASGSQPQWRIDQLTISVPFKNRALCTALHNEFPPRALTGYPRKSCQYPDHASLGFCIGHCLDCPEVQAIFWQCPLGASLQALYRSGGLVATGVHATWNAAYKFRKSEDFIYMISEYRFEGSIRVETCSGLQRMQYRKCGTFMNPLPDVIDKLFDGLPKMGGTLLSSIIRKSSRLAMHGYK